METIITIILGIIILALLHFIGNPILFIIGKFILRIVTLNNYPNNISEKKQVQISITVGFVLVFALIAGYFFIRNN
jgi:hypothetical protein